LPDSVPRRTGCAPDAATEKFAGGENQHAEGTDCEHDKERSQQTEGESNLN
jgi:hypothetical protein